MGRPADGDDVRSADVAEALDRLAQGSFARCDVCGTQVDDRRLRIAPETRRCVRHRTVAASGHR